MFPASALKLIEFGSIPVKLPAIRNGISPEPDGVADAELDADVETAGVGLLEDVAVAGVDELTCTMGWVVGVAWLWAVAPAAAGPWL